MEDFFYHSKGNEHVTVAGKIKDNRLLFGVAKCKKGDRFSKRVGRNLTLGRIAESKHVDEYPFATIKHLQMIFQVEAKSIVRRIRKRGFSKVAI